MLSKKGYHFEDASYKIIALAIKVHKNLGPGFEEVIYQTLSYLKTTKYKTALLINFGSKKIIIKRIVNSGIFSRASPFS